MENQKRANSDDIDLGVLFSKIGDFFRNIWLGIIRFLATLRRVPLQNRLSFVSIIVASMLIGFMYSKYLQKNYYETTMILNSEYLNKRLVESSIEKLNLLAGEKNKKGLSDLLHLSDTLADNILGFKSTPFIAEQDIVETEVLKERLKTAKASAGNEQIIDDVIARIEIENRHAFEITVRTLNPTVIPNLQEAIVTYFKQNSYIKKRIEINKANLLERKEKFAQDLQKLDSLKKVINQNYSNLAKQSRQGSNNVILSDEALVDPVQIYQQDANLYLQFQDVNRQLYLQPDFEVVDGFAEYSEPANPSLFKMILYSVLVGIVIAYLDVALRSFNRYLATIE